jgi:hypothetical protein
MEPIDREKNDGIIIEFKVFDKRREKDLQDTVSSALKQIEEKNYAQSLIDRGVKAERIRKYGFAFEGKTVEIGETTVKLTDREEEIRILKEKLARLEGKS